MLGAVGERSIGDLVAQGETARATAVEGLNEREGGEVSEGLSLVGRPLRVDRHRLSSPRSIPSLPKEVLPRKPGFRSRTCLRARGRPPVATESTAAATGLYEPSR